MNFSKELILGDCLDKMKEMEDNSIDTIVTDPPYGLSFMGKKWDYDVPSQEIWEECLRVLKPGGYLLSFAGTRTQHRMAVRIEDAGFEIRDMIAWIYGSGFPKSLNIGKAVDKLQGNEREVEENPKAKQQTAKTTDNTYGKYNANTHISKGTSEWEGWGTALKPALEPITVARKPLEEKTVAKNCLKWGVGGINIDGSRVPTSYNSDDTSVDNNENIVLLHKLSELRGKLYTLLFSCVADKKGCPTPSNADEYVQSWKALQDCLGDCSICLHLYDELSPLFLKGDQVSVQQLHDVHDDISRLQQEQSDNPFGQDTDHLSSLGDFSQLVLSYLNDTTLHIESKPQGRFPANLIHDGSDEVVELFPDTHGHGSKRHSGSKSSLFGNGKEIQTTQNGGESGSASRFFYCAKASKKERNVGCEDMEEKNCPKMDGGEFINPMTGVSSKATMRQNNHPTVKPIALMEYLVKLVSREGATVLDPFMGSGTTGMACKKLGREFIGIEMNEDYMEIAKARIESVEKELSLGLD